MKSNIIYAGLIRLSVLFLIVTVGFFSCNKENVISTNEKNVNAQVAKEDSNTQLVNYKLDNLSESDFILSTMKFYDTNGSERSLESLSDEPVYYFRVETTLDPTNFCCEVDFKILKLFLSFLQAL